MTAKATEAPFNRLGLVGLGLIGGSIAKRVRLLWPDAEIAGLDTADRVASAVHERVITHGAETLSTIATADLVLLAVPVDAMPGLIRGLAALETRALVTDVGSTKRLVMQTAVDSGLRSFIGGHPMAGAEQGGLVHARGDLFERRVWWLVRGRPAPDADGRLAAFVRALGAIPRWTDAEAHDRVMAYVSHLPQLLATTLMTVAADAAGDGAVAAAGNAFAEMTRLASSPADMWTGILDQNSDFIAEALDALRSQLPDEGRLADPEWVHRAFGAAAAARTRWRRAQRALDDPEAAP